MLWAVFFIVWLVLCMHDSGDDDTLLWRFRASWPYLLSLQTLSDCWWYCGSHISWTLFYIYYWKKSSRSLEQQLHIEYFAWVCKAVFLLHNVLALLQLFDRYIIKHTPFYVRNLELFMDNAGKTNKNMPVLAFLRHTVQTGRFDTVFVSFMIAGHTKVCSIKL